MWSFCYFYIYILEKQKVRTYSTVRRGWGGVGRIYTAAPSMLCLQRTQGHAPGRRGFRLQGGESKHAVLWKARLLELSSSVAEKALYITQTFKELTRNWIVWCQLIPLFIDNPILTKEERGAWGKHKEVLNRGEWWGGEGVVYLNLQPGRTGRKVLAINTEEWPCGEGHILITKSSTRDTVFIHRM